MHQVVDLLSLDITVASCLISLGINTYYIDLLPKQDNCCVVLRSHTNPHNQQSSSSKNGHRVGGRSQGDRA